MTAAFSGKWSRKTLAIVLSVLFATAACARHPAASAGYVEVPGGELYYEEYAQGAEVVVLIHGNAGDQRHWDGQMEALAHDHRVIRYDVRGFGRSSLPKEGARYSDRRDLVVLLDNLDIESAHLVGWSMGSGIAIDFAIAHPQRVESLIAVGPWVNGYDSPAVRQSVREFAAVAAKIEQQGVDSALDAWMQAPSFAATIRDPAAEREFRRIAADYSWWAMMNASQQVPLEPAAAQRLSEISAPTLLVTAEHDISACREIAGLLHRSIRNSTMVVMERTGHLMHMERPQAFNQLLISFLRKGG